MRAPEQPNGCPRAMAPPFTLVISWANPISAITANACTANASFNSIKPKSETCKPARCNALRDAGIGPNPMTRGSTPAAAQERMRTSGLRPRLAAFSALINTNPAAPSFIPEEFPAVTEPPSRKTGFKRARVSGVVSRRGRSSRLTMIDDAFLWGTVNGKISSSNLPASTAATARR